MLSQEQQEELDRLTNQILELGKKLKDFHKQLAYLADVPKVYELTMQVREIREQMDQLGFKQEQLIRFDYCSSMLSINYTDQVNPVLKHLNIHKQSCGAFLICGPLEFGQLWVLKRTIKGIGASRLKPSCDFNFNNPHQSKDPLKIWSAIGNQLQILGQKTPQEVTRVILGRLATQHVVLVFRHIQELQEGQLTDLIENVWKPLVEGFSQEKSLEKYPYKLVAFFLDYSGDTCQWNLPCVPPGDSPPQPAYYPIRLENLTRFNLAHLEKWAEGEGETILGLKILENPTAAQNLLADSDNGIPERVAEELLRLHGLDYVGEDLWMMI
jgi:hypothetical protein